MSRYRAAIPAILVPQKVSFMGSSLFSPHIQATESGTWHMSQTANGPHMDCLNGNTGNGLYGVFGTSQADSVVEAVISQNAGYSGTGNDPNFPNSGYQHVGVGVRWTDVNDFAVLAMFSAASQEAQIVYKVTGTETIQQKVSMPVQFNQQIKIVVSVVGTACTITYYDYNTGTQLYTYSFTIAAGTPASGFPIIHAYSAAVTCYSMKVWDGTSVPLVGATSPFASIAAVSGNGGTLIDANGNLNVYSDGTNNSPNEWAHHLSPITAKNVVIKGTLNYQSGRLWGISFRQSGTGTGYIWLYDNNTPKVAIRTGQTNASADIKNWTVTAFPTATDLPFEIIVKDNEYSLTINGQMFGYHDTTYLGSGFIGFVGYQSHFQVKNLEVFPF